jgi:hypothetical protein
MRGTQEQEPVFVAGMIRIEPGDGERMAKAVAASSKDTPCFARFRRAFSGSHSNRIPVTSCPCGNDTGLAAAVA